MLLILFTTTTTTTNNFQGKTYALHIKAHNCSWKALLIVLKLLQGGKMMDGKVIEEGENSPDFPM